MGFRGVVIAIAVALSLLAVPSGRAAALAPATSGDVAAIGKALKRAHLPRADRLADLTEARRSLVASGRIGGQAGTELRAVLASAAGIARRSGFTPERALAIFTELATNRRYLAVHGLPAPRSRVTIDNLVFQRYAGQGLRYMPLATWSTAQAADKAGDTDALLATVDAALQLAVPRRGALDVEYLFPFEGGSPPWRSPLASAVAMDACARAFDVTQDPRYDDAARRLLADVLHFGQGPAPDLWFPLYSFAPGLRVLNADLQVAIDLRAVDDVLDAPEAATAFERAVRTIVHRLPRYDEGGWSRYSEGTEAPLEYHVLQTLQLRQLATLTEDPTIIDYAHRFAADLTTPPAATAAGTAAPAFYPVPRDGFRDDATVSYRLSKPAAVEAIVREAAGRLVDVIPLGQLRGGLHAFTWRPASVPAGGYRLDVAAVDLAGNHGTSTGVAGLTVVRDTTPPAIIAARVVHGVLHWRVRDVETPWVRIVVRLKKRVLVLARAARAGHLRVGAKARSVRFSDSSGNSITVELRAGPRARSVPPA